MSFGENLKNIRKQRSITQEELAEALGVSRQAISKWESGNGYPETEKLIIISKTLKRKSVAVCIKSTYFFTESLSLIFFIGKYPISFSGESSEICLDFLANFAA